MQYYHHAPVTVIQQSRFPSQLICMEAQFSFTHVNGKVHVSVIQSRFFFPFNRLEEWALALLYAFVLHYHTKKHPQD